MSILGEELKVYKEKNNIQFKQLAKELNISDVHLINIINKDHAFGLEIMVQIINLLDLPPEYLFHEELTIDNSIVLEKVCTLLRGLSDEDLHRAVEIIKTFVYISTEEKEQIENES